MKIKTVLLFFVILVFCTAFHVSADDYMTQFWGYTAAVTDGDPVKICSAVDALDAALPSPRDANEHNKLIWAFQTAARENMKLENYDKALYYYRKFVSCAEWLQANDAQHHEENITFANAMINHLELPSELYVACEYPEDAVYYGAKNEPRYGVFNGTCNGFDAQSETAHLLYVRFFDETIESFFYMLPDEDAYLLVAWNLPHESREELELIRSGAADEYIISNLEYLATIEQKVLLRFGAEVNCWAAIPTEISAIPDLIKCYKDAFIHIAELARKYAPDVAMVYSPNDISNIHVTAEDFYPGDEYVDWVGMSTYSVIQPGASFLPADEVDAYYFRGLFDKPIAKIRHVVEAFGDRKPILISECGFAYDTYEGQTEAHAVKKIGEFYTYLNMVYPQIKGVLYFDADYERKFKLDGDIPLSQAYDRLRSENVGMQAMLYGTNEGYTRFTTYEGNAKSVELYAYATYPSQNPINVTYTLDSQPLASSPELPYRATLDISSLADGEHTLEMNITCGNYTEAKTYAFYIDNGKLTHTNPFILPFSDVTQNDWFFNDVRTAYNNKLINGKGDTYCPYDNMTYAEAVKLASCMHQLYNSGNITLTNGQQNWYDSYDSYALENGIISESISDIADSFITRKDFVGIFAAAFPKEEFIIINNIPDNAIPDVVFNVEDGYSEQIYDFYRAGILTGSDGGYFKPDSNINRGEVAAILTRLFDRTARKSFAL